MPTTKTFTDESKPGPSGPITAWDLDYGDGSSHGSGPGPWSHDYADGVYQATLQVTGTAPDGTASATHNVTIDSGGGGLAYTWDATAATVDPDSASKMAAFWGYCGDATYFVAEVGYAEVTSHSLDVYSISTSGKPGAMDGTIWLPNDVKAGLSNDKHLCIRDNVTNRWHDFDGCSFDSSGHLSNWIFGSSMPVDVVNVPIVSGKTHQGATAAMLPLAQGVVTPDEIAASLIPHAMVFVAANLGPGDKTTPNPYPAERYGYDSGNQPSGSSVTGHIQLGAWIAVDSGASIPGGLPAWEHTVAVALQAYGCFCRDRGSTFGLHAIDPGGGGQGNFEWAAQGITLNTAGGNDKKFSSAFTTWLKANAQLLLPPTGLP